MDGGQTDRERLAFSALQAWRRDLLSSGTAADQLPPESDLRRIARSPDRNSFERLGLVRPEAVKRFQPGILNVLRTVSASPPPDARPAAGASEKPSSTAEPTRAEPVRTEPVRTEPARSEAARTDPARTDPARTESARTKPARTQSARTEPARSEPARTGSVRPQAGRSGTAGDEPVSGGFAARDLTAPASEPTGYLRTLTVANDSELFIRWDEIDDGPNCVLYRVVSSDEHMPYSPESGDTVTTTSGTQYVDRRPFHRALRHIQVWANRGVSEAVARREQPQLLCQGTVVAPVQSLDVREDNGTVTGSWSVPTGVMRVEVLRVPEHEASARPGYLHEYLITPGQDCRAGFQDAGCEPGQAYEYRIFTMAEIGDRITMTAVSRLVRITASLDPVLDLQALMRGTGAGTVVDLEWTPPRRGQVQIYRTPTGPEPGADEAPVPLRALGDARLPADDRLNQPVQQSDGDPRHRLVAVPWPQGWDTVYFTPVSVHLDQARIGRSQGLARAGAIQDARLVQLVDCQLLTLSWPSGAAQIQVHLTQPGIPISDVVGEPVAQLSRGVYESQGGLRLRGILSPFGCAVHVIPVSFYGGELVRGEGVTLHYPGLVTLYYRFRTDTNIRDRMLRRQASQVLEVYSDQIDGEPPKLVIVHNEHRLPLDIRDGRTTHVIQAYIRKGQWCDVHRLNVDPNRPGYIRLFADVQPDFPADFAVLDPPLPELRGGV
jgi:hypothetical protein